LLPVGDSRRAAIAIDLTYVLVEAGALTEADEVIQDALLAADPVLRARGRLAEVEVRPFLDDALGIGWRTTSRTEALAVLEAAEDDVGLARYWWSMGWDSWAGCRAEEALDRWERGRRHAEAAGAQALTRELESRLVACLILGPTPVAEALPRAEGFVRRAEDSPLLEAYALQAVGMLRAMEGRVDEGRELVRSGWRTIRDAGHTLNAAGISQRFAFVERRAGGPDVEQRIETVLREGFEQLRSLDDRGFLPTVALDLAHCAVRQNRFDEARELCTFARERTLSDDLINFLYLDLVEAHIAAEEGRLEEAERLARHGVELADTTDFFGARGMRARGALAEILQLAGKEDEAHSVAVAGMAFHEEKGDVAGGAALREELVRAGVVVA